MDSELLEARIEIFKQNIADGLEDPSLSELPLDEFMESVALTPREKAEAKSLLRELNIKR